jgi:peptidyl-tRNA hydrolase, PTH1 family
VAALARFFKIAPEEMLVAHDELDLPPGQMRLKQGGGVAGHNGLRDMQAQLGSPNFWRLRLGIGHPGVKAEVADYVLRKATQEDRKAIEDTIVRSLESLELMMTGEMTRAMMALHKKPASAETAAPATRPSTPAQRSS